MSKKWILQGILAGIGAPFLLFIIGSTAQYVFTGHAIVDMGERIAISVVICFATGLAFAGIEAEMKQ
jgi:hypothetical protein